jgi:hypothetical protein
VFLATKSDHGTRRAAGSSHNQAGEVSPRHNVESAAPRFRRVLNMLNWWKKVKVDADFGSSGFKAKWFIL